MEHETQRADLLTSATAGDIERFRELARDSQPADIAEAVDGLEPETARDLLWSLPPDRCAEVFGYLPVARQVAIAESSERRQLVRLFTAMSADERADLFNQLEDERKEMLLPALAQAEREDVRRLAAYEEGTVGAVMTSEYATLPPDLTVREAIEHLRRVAPDKETIYQAFVLDEGRRLLGTLSLRDLIVAPAWRKVEAIMRREVVSVNALAPRAEAADLVARYDLLALPVVDDHGTLVGIVTYDDAMDVAEAEATEDIQRVGSVTGIETSLRETGIGELYRKRVFWLVLLVFGNIFSGAGIAYFEETISAHLALLFFLPLLIASAGNAGSQAATLTIRALATGDVQMRDWTLLLGRELLVASLLGLTMALAISAIGWIRAGPEITAVVCLTMVAVVLVGSLVGMLLPFCLSLLKLDPATASTPLVTSIADVAGVVIYFGIAAALLLPGG